MLDLRCVFAFVSDHVDIFCDLGAPSRAAFSFPSPRSSEARLTVALHNYGVRGFEFYLRPASNKSIFFFSSVYSAQMIPVQWSPGSKFKFGAERLGSRPCG